MCGIVGYAGGRQALDVVLGGLRRLEYRGYDSAGIAVLADGKVFACELADALGHDVDQPRNLAKSVTVELPARPWQAETGAGGPAGRDEQRERGRS